MQDLAVPFCSRHFLFNFRDVIESRDLEYKAWAHVQSLKSSLDEHNLELRVKAANEAEAVSQQKLATAEAEFADLRQKLETSVRLTSLYLFYLLLMNLFCARITNILCNLVLWSVFESAQHL